MNATQQRRRSFESMANETSTAIAVGSNTNTKKKKKRRRDKGDHRRRIPPNRDALIQVLAKQRDSLTARAAPIEKEESLLATPKISSKASRVANESTYNLKNRQLGDEGVSTFVDLFFHEHAFVSSSSVDSCKNGKLTSSTNQAGEKQLHLIYLYQLNLSQNKISVAGANDIARMVFSIKSILCVLNLSSNELRDEGCCALFAALVPEGSIARQHFHSLKELNLSNNSIGPVGSIAIAKYLQAKASATSKCPLRRLNLRNNNIGDEGAKTLSTAIFSSHYEAAKFGNSLRALNISRNLIGAIGCNMLLAHHSALNKQASLTEKGSELHLSNYSLEISVSGNPGATPKVTSTLQLNYVHMKLSTEITYCDLSSLDLNDDAAVYIAELLGSLPKLRILDLSQNSITVVGIQALANSIERLIASPNKEPPNLEQIILVKNPSFSTPASRHLLGNLCVLHLLRLAKGSNEENRGGIGTAFRSISDRDIRDEGAKCVARWLSKLCSCPKDNSEAGDYENHSYSLLELGLHMNRIGMEGCKAICGALAEPEATLTDLSIYGNLRGTFWGEHCANMLRHNEHLLVLDLGGNGIGDPGAIALARALDGSKDSSKSLKTNSTLTDLHLDHCDIGRFGTEALCCMLASNTSLTNLWLHGNNNSEAASVCFDIQKSLERNREGYMARASKTSCKRMTLKELQARGCNAYFATNASQLVLPDGCGEEKAKNILDDTIAKMTAEQYRKSCPSHVASWRGGQTVLAGIAISRDVQSPGSVDKRCIDVSLVAFGVGTKFLAPAVADALDKYGDVTGQIDLVRDSHAEVLARRAFVRYLHGQIALLCPIDPSGGGDRSTGGSEFQASIFERVPRCDSHSSSDFPERQFWCRLKHGFKVHLYVSLAPCGLATLGKDVLKELTPFQHDENEILNTGPGVLKRCMLVKRNSGSGLQTQSKASSTVVLTNNYSTLTLPGGFTVAPQASSVIGNKRLRSSCTDKIIRWQHLGMQGGLLSGIIQDTHKYLAPSSIIIGRRFDAERCAFGLSCIRSTKGCSSYRDGPVLARISGCTSNVDACQEMNCAGATAKTKFSGKKSRRKKRSVFGAGSGRSQGGDGDECLVWTLGAGLSRHDGRTGRPMMPSSEVTKRLGERSVVSTGEMQEEFAVLARHIMPGQCLDKEEVASKEWLAAKRELYEGTHYQWDEGH